MKLNLGAGSVPLAGYENWDLGYEDNARFGLQMDGIHYRKAEVYPLPEPYLFQYDEIRASHVLEHFGHGETMDVLTDWVRCLAPGGLLKIAVPDFRKIIEAYEAGDPLAEAYCYGGQTDERDYHKAGFDEETLMAAFEALGLVDIKRWNDGAQDCSSLPVSLNLCGRKPGGEPVAEEAPGVEHYPRVVCTSEGARAVCGCGFQGPWRTGPDGEELAHEDGQEHLASVEPEPEVIEARIDLAGIVAVMTAPRLGFMDASHVHYRAFGSLNIPLIRSGGVFWDQGITRVIESAIAAGNRYIITLDYDSLFVKEDVLRLLWIMDTTPGLDAVAALQMRRELNSPLFHTGKVKQAGEWSELTLDGDTLAQETLPCVTAHFGLTVFRASSFARVEKPWFHSIPDNEGGWSEGRMDSDIAFWHRWKEAGNTVATALRVPIGHLELVSSWPDRRMQQRWQRMQDYALTGKPDWAWQ